MSLILPFLLLLVFGVGLWKKRPVFADFCDGVREGLEVCLRIFPTLILMLVSVGVFRASGAMEGLVLMLDPLCRNFQIPSPILPLALVRPLSGGGALSLCQDLLRTYGADSLVGRTAAVLSASTETTFYTLGVYLPQGKGKGFGKFLACALFCDAVTFLLCVLVCRFLFPN